MTERLIGIHSMVFASQWNAQGALRACKGASAAGFNCIEISLMVPEIDCEMTKKLLHDYSLTPTCSLGLSFDTDISSKDEQVRARGEELLNKCLTTASQIGAHYLVGVYYSALGKYGAPAKLSNYEHSAAVLRRLNERAESLGISLGLEPCNRYETNLLNTTNDTRTFIVKHLGASNNFHIHLDSYHMHIETRYEDAVSSAGDLAGYLHIGDSTRGELGSGNVDFKRIFTALKSIDFKGPIVFESFSREPINDSPAVIESLAVWRTSWKSDEAEAVANRARQFISQEMQAVNFE